MINAKLLNKMKTVSKDDIDKRRKEGIEEEKSLKKNTSGRNSSSDVIEFDIYEDDDLIVESIKLEVNNAKITLDSIYDRVGRSVGWNMYYGLTKRRTATVKTYQMWAELLGMGVVIKLVPLSKQK
jgi:hypothetical protein